MQRGLVVVAAGLIVWAASRLSGSAGLHLIAVGMVVLPLVAWVVGARRTGTAFTVIRHLPTHRARVGETIDVSLTVRNRSYRTSSFLLLEDRLPVILGGRRRRVLDRIPPGNAQTVSYALTPERRGRFTLPHPSLQVSDPFDLTRLRLEVGETTELLVAPHVEPLAGMPRGAFGAGRGESVTRQLYLSGQEFYAIREYQQGDDLRRIHWGSTARSGQLMIRQDEMARRASAVLFLDTRSRQLGDNGSPAFEKAVSAAASLASLVLDSGYTLRLSTTDQPLTRMTEDGMLEHLATIGPSGSQRLGAGSVRAAADAATTLLLVSGIPGDAGVDAVLAAGSGYGQKVAVLVRPVDTALAASELRDEHERRATVVHHSLMRAGWMVIVLQPSGSLEEAWRNQTVASAS